MSLDLSLAKQWVRQARQGDSNALANLLAPDTSLLPSEFSERNRKRYQRALARLEPDYRQAILLRQHLKLGFEDIARDLSLVNVESARLLCERASLRLHTLLAESAGPQAQLETD